MRRRIGIVSAVVVVAAGASVLSLRNRIDPAEAWRKAKARGVRDIHALGFDDAGKLRSESWVSRRRFAQIFRNADTEEVIGEFREDGRRRYSLEGVVGGGVGPGSLDLRGDLRDSEGENPIDSALDLEQIFREGIAAPSEEAPSESLVLTGQEMTPVSARFDGAVREADGVWIDVKFPKRGSSVRYQARVLRDGRVTEIRPGSGRRLYLDEPGKIADAVFEPRPQARAARVIDSDAAERELREKYGHPGGIATKDGITLKVVASAKADFLVIWQQNPRLAPFGLRPLHPLSKPETRPLPGHHFVARHDPGTDLGATATLVFESADRTITFEGVPVTAVWRTSGIEQELGLSLPPRRNGGK